MTYADARGNWHAFTPHHATARKLILDELEQRSPRNISRRELSKTLTLTRVEPGHWKEVAN